jgi:hypothetical protein
MFPDVAIVREVQQELDTVIEEGVVNIVNLLKNQVSFLFQESSRPATTVPVFPKRWAGFRFRTSFYRSSSQMD